MSRARYWFLYHLARTSRWAWLHLVDDNERRDWAAITGAMAAQTLHVRDWATGTPIPAWVPCRPCGGGPCRRRLNGTPANGGSHA